MSQQLAPAGQAHFQARMDRVWKGNRSLKAIRYRYAHEPRLLVRCLLPRATARWLDAILLAWRLMLVQFGVGLAFFAALPKLVTLAGFD